MTESASSELIVCATDFSPEAASALAWAAAFARREGGRIDLVHVLPVGHVQAERAERRADAGTDAIA